jgi:hypothetical protein
MAGIAHSSMRSKNFAIVYHALDSSFSQPAPLYGGWRYIFSNFAFSAMATFSAFALSLLVTEAANFLLAGRKPTTCRLPIVTHVVSAPILGPHRAWSRRWP